jgi:hypothetical protein
LAVERACGYVGLTLAALAVCAHPLAAQTIQFPRAAPPTAPVVSVPATGNVITAPPPGATAAPSSPYGGGTLGPAPFDPYSASGSSAYNFWSTTPPSNATGVFGQQPPTPYGQTTPFPTSPAIPPGGSFPTYGPPPPTATAPSQYVFPNGVGNQWDLSQSIRFIQDVRLRQTYLHGGDDANDLGINDTEVAVTFTIPNFLTTGQPLFISPAFALHLWDGPISPPADLPPQAYSAYLDFQWASDPKLQIGAELGFRIGVYSDFNTLNDESLRIQGLGLGVFRLTPTLTFKIGAMYLDRNKIKILPAGGLLWTPTPQVRFDFFFPQPKLSAYLTTVGQYELWWYLAGEYGGGAWTIERADGTSDAIDINDIRASAGLEWTGPRGLTGFIEAGFVFKRQVVYVVDPSDSFDPGDTFMLRAGVSF